MESTIKHCIINAGIGGWYPKGSERLERSLIYHGYTGDILIWKNEWPNDNYDKSCIYNIKAAAFEEAIKRGYTHIFWMDCSTWIVYDIAPLFDKLNEKGWYITSSGYNCAQTCNDKSIEYFGFTRDEAEKIKDTSTCSFGVNINNPKGEEFAKLFIQSAKDGIFGGSRLHDGQSSDPRFMFHRQDQSAASLIAGKLEMELSPINVEICYYADNRPLPESTIITLRGM
jgi:hypothetical protein